MPPIAAATAIGSSALGQSPAPAAQLLRTQTAFDIVVHLPYAEAAPLFGPEGERPWAGKHWNPQFLYPRPAHDEQGAVFTVHHGPVTAVWVNTLFDLNARHFQYVYFIPDIMVTTIDVAFHARRLNTPRSTSSTPAPLSLRRQRPRHHLHRQRQIRRRRLATIHRRLPRDQTLRSSRELKK